MLPRLVIGGILLALALGLGYGMSRMMERPQPLGQARALLEAKQPAGAQPILRQLVRAEARNAEAHVLLARTQLDLNDPVAAEKELKIARVLRYERTVVNPLLAQAYLMQGRYDDILTDLPESAERPEERFQNLVWRARAYLGMGDLRLAEDSLTAAAALQPDDLEVSIAQARLALSLDEQDRARELIDKAGVRAPENVDVMLLRAALLAKVGSVDAAVLALDKAAKIAPFSVQVRLQRAEYLMMLRRDQEAQRDVDAALSVDARNSSALLTHALLVMRAGRNADALTELQRLAPVMDQMPRGYLYQAQASAVLGQEASALDLALRYLKLVPKDGEALRLAGRLALKLDQPTRAVAVLTAGVEGGVRDGALYDLLGRAYFMSGKMVDAVAAYREATVLEPGNPEYAAHLSAAAQFGPKVGVGVDGGRGGGSRE